MNPIGSRQAEALRKEHHIAVPVIEVEHGWVGAFISGDFALADQSFHQDAVIYVNGGPKRDLTWPEFKAMAQAIKAAFPDLSFSIDYQFISKDKIMYLWSATDPHSRPFGDIGLPGKKALLKGLVISRVRDGKVAERWEFWDQTWPLDQIGHSQTNRE